MSHRCHQLVYVNLSMSLKEVIPHMPSLHRALYNNLLYREGEGDTHTDTVYPCTENVTNKHQVIKVVTKNKTCSKHGHLLDKSSVDHHCSPGVCGANLPMHHTIGDEFIWGSLKKYHIDFFKDSIYFRSTPLSVYISK